MKSLKYVMVELLAVLRNWKVLIPVIGVIVIPLLYSSIFLWAFWDPYGKLSDLPVAVVNEDKGAVFDGKDMKLGDEFVDKLKESKTFDWQFVTQEEAMQGLKDNRYYLAFEIPENFSAKATNVLDEHPDAAVFKFYPNESYNFTSSQMGRSAVEKMKGELSGELTKAYTETMFTNIHKLTDGVSAAADGAQKLSDGTKKVEDGIVQVSENISKLVEGAIPLKNGASELFDGAVQLEGGLAQLKQGAGQLTSGLGQLEDGHKQLADAAKQSEAGASQLKAGLDGATDGAGKVKAGTAGVASGLEQYVAAHPDLAKDPAFMQIVETAKATASGADSLEAGQKTLAEGAGKLASGGGQLSAGMDMFGQKLGEAKQGGQSVEAGASSLIEGSAKLKNGLASLAGGVTQLSDGTIKLEEGAKSLTEGAGTVASGSSELSGKLKEASDQTSGIKDSDETYDKVSQPVKVDEEKLNPVPNYGTGIAPYFISLGLFVGALLLTIVFSLTEPAGAPKSGFAMFLGKLGFMLIVGTIQTVIVDLVALYGIGLEVKSVPLFFALSLITSWSFMALIQLLVTTMGNPGRFIAIIILIMQLTTSAGTFPLELIPDGLQRVNGWLPMAYSVPGFRAVISSGDFAYMWQNAAVIGGFGLGFALLTMIYFMITFKKPKATGDTAVNAA